MIDRPIFTFRQAQAVHDLCHAALPFVEPDFADILRHRAGLFEMDDDLKVFERVLDSSGPVRHAVLLVDAL